MRSGSFFISAVLASGLVLALPPSSVAQNSSSAPPVTIAVADPDLLEAPTPQLQAAAAGQGQSTQQPAPNATPEQNSAAQESSSAQSPAGQTSAEKSEHDKAEEELRQQEQQRVWGVMATFNTTRNPDALPLSVGQKYRLFFKSATDPWAFSLASAVASIGQAHDDEPEWGQGIKGYSTRFGAAYSDYFIGNFFGNAVLPSLLHEDPRYFQKGSGTVFSRAMWAADSTVWCKRDRGGWGPNWSNVMGNLIGTAIGRVYYPSADRTVSGTISDGLTVTAEGIIGSEVIEFWPDVVRRHRRKQAEKLARLTAKTDSRSAAEAPLAEAPLKDDTEKQDRQNQNQP